VRALTNPPCNSCVSGGRFSTTFSPCRSLVLTTNLPFSEWTIIFPNAATATELIDRVVHHAEIITIEGDSYSRRVAEARRKSSPAI
jgi:hypothetical protein